MSLSHFPEQQQVVELLQRSLERGRLAHAYLFTGHALTDLEGVARALAKTLNCQNPRRSPGGQALDCCDACLTCRKIDHENHADVRWVRPESKTRIITIDQTRELMQEVNLKPTEAEYKVAVIVSAERMKTEAANAFLKTLEEPPARSIFILLSTEPQQLLETILSRCLRLAFAGEGMRELDPVQMDWLKTFSELAAAGEHGLLGRYRLLGSLVSRLGNLKEVIESNLTSQSPLQRYDELDPKLREKLEEELKASIEAEYRRQRADVLRLLQYWLRDVWIAAHTGGEDLQYFASLRSETRAVAGRISPAAATGNLDIMEQTQRLLGNTNVQEALALEVGLLKLTI